MSYATLILDEKVSHKYLIKLSPFRRVTGFALVSGSTYSVSFTLGEVVGISDQGSALAQASSSTLSAGEFYFDTDTSVLYVRLTGGQNPNTRWVIGNYEITMATFDAHWYRIPTDSSTRTVYWDPVVIEEPNITRKLSDTLAGYVPVQSTSLKINNAEHFLEQHLVGSSFYRATVEVWHWIDELDTANIKKILLGFTEGVTYSDEKVNLKLKDQFDLFTPEYRNLVGDKEYSLATFPNLDQQHIGRPIRTVYGMVDGFIPANIDYVEENPTTSDNRDWVCVSGQLFLDEKAPTVPAAPTSTTTRTYVTSASGLNIGDTVILDSATDYYREITNVFRGTNPYIEHAAVGVALTTGDTVRRGFVGHVKIIKDGVTHTALYGRDYTCSLAFAGTSSGFSFTTSMESNLSIGTLNASDRVLARVYGPANSLTMGGPAFGGDSAITGNMATAPQLILDLLKNQCGLTDADVNQTMFTAALSDSTDTIGVSIPEDSSGSSPKLKELLIKYLKSGLLRLSIDAGRKFYIKSIEPFIGSDHTIDSTEIIEDSFSWDFDYTDLASLVVVEYRPQEGSYSPVSTGRNTVATVSATSDEAQYLHRARKTTKLETNLVDVTEAQTYADRMAFNFGSHESKIKLRARSAFFETLIGDVIEIGRLSMPGVGTNLENYLTASILVHGTSRDIDSIELTGTDQKGIQDNSGSW